MGRPLCYQGDLSFQCHKNQQLRRHKSEGGERSKNQTLFSGNPINVETNVTETVTPEEYIRDTFRNVSDSEKEQVCGTLSKPTPKQF